MTENFRQEIVNVAREDLFARDVALMKAYYKTTRDKANAG